MIDRSKRAIVYLAWGRKYIEEAVRSATTAAIVGVDRLLITNTESRGFLPPDAPFERVIDHTFRLPGMLAKSEMVDLLPAEYESFLYLDTDTFILMDIDQGFEKAEQYGIAAAPAAAYSLEHFWGFEKVLAELGIRSRDILQYNAGVIFFTRYPAAWRVMNKYHEFCSTVGGGEPSWTDQPYLTLSMELFGFNPYTLSIAYNYRNFGEIANGRIRIWHSHELPPADVNEFDGNWPFRRFWNSRRLQEPPPRI